MRCNYKNSLDENNVISFIKGTTAKITFNFDEDISLYSYGIITIRKNYDETPVISKNASIEENNIIDIELTKTETDNFNQFENGKTSSNYIWGLDLVDTVNNIQINVFPQTGEPAPLCIVYKHVVEEV